MVTIMGKNIAQKQAEARAKAVTPVTEQPKAAPATVAAAAPAAVSKQTTTIEKLMEGWKTKGVNLDKLTVKDDGKYKLLIVGKGWPTVQVGASGGITVLELKSYPNAFDAAMDGLTRYEKQQGREAKKANGTVAAPAVAPKQTATA
jgi:hypothetical protein